MFGNNGIRTDSDSKKLLLLAAILFSVLALAYVASAADDSSADGGQVDGTTYFYDQLTPAEKMILDKIDEMDFTVTENDDVYYATFVFDISDFCKDKTKAEIDSMFGDVPHKVLRTILWERPTYYWVTNSGMNVQTSYSFIEGKATSCSFTVRFNNILTDYGSTRDQIVANMGALNTFINSLDCIDTTDRISTVTSIHNYICGLLSYYQPPTPSDPIPATMDIRNLYTGLLGDHVVVCEGYSRAFKALCDHYDVPCLIIVGTGVGTSSSAGHMWNQVQMENDRWYLVDCTWDDADPTVSTYLLAGTTSSGFNGKTIAQDHLLSTGDDYTLLTVPSISSKGFNDDRYTWTFINYDDSVIKTITDIAYETDSSTLGIPASASYTDAPIGTFNFTGWSPGVPTTVTKDMTFKAQYSIDYVEYTLTFHPENGHRAIHLPLQR